MGHLVQKEVSILEVNLRMTEKACPSYEFEYLH